MRRQIFQHGRGAVLVTLLALPLLMVDIGSVLGQDEAPKERDRARFELSDPAKDAQGDAIRQRIRERIENEAGLEEPERLRLREQLRQCEELGLDAAALEVLFEEGPTVQERIRQQERVMKMLREGLPPEPVLEKLREGLRKNASSDAVENACVRMESNVRAASHFLASVVEDGVQRGERHVEGKLTQSMAKNMWRGFDEQDMQRLRDRARQRLRLNDGECSTTDLAAAAQTATDLIEMGVGHERAVELAGTALENGYTAREVRQLAFMVMAAHGHGNSAADAVETLARGLDGGEPVGDIYQHMWQYRWMGPAEDHGGHGGRSPVDDVIGGPHGPGNTDPNRRGGSDDSGNGGSGGSDGGAGGGNGARSSGGSGSAGGSSSGGSTGSGGSSGSGPHRG